jgi:hypothetical protein
VDFPISDKGFIKSVNLYLFKNVSVWISKLVGNLHRANKNLHISQNSKLLKNAETGGPIFGQRVSITSWIFSILKNLRNTFCLGLGWGSAQSPVHRRLEAGETR